LPLQPAAATGRQERNPPRSPQRQAEQVLSVDEAAAGLAEALRRLLLAEAKHVDALFADASRKSGEIAIGRNEAKPSKRPLCSRSIASMTSVMSDAFLPVVQANCCCGMMA